MVLELISRARCTGGSSQGGWCKTVLTGALLVVAIFGASCAPEQPTPTPTSFPVDPKEELQRTVKRLMALNSVSFDLQHEVGSTSILPGVLMNRAYGVAVVPGKFDITVEGELLFPRSYIEIMMISLEDRSYMTNLINAEWEEVSPGSLPINLGDFGMTLADIVDNVDAPELLGDDRLDGVDVYHIGGGITSEVLKELVPTAGTGFPVALEMWTERQSGMLRRALITGKVVATDVEDSKRILTLADVDEPVAIEPPEL